MQIRIDALRLDAPKVDDDGFLNADAFVTRTGVFDYRHADGSITHELRHPDQVFSADSLSTLRRRPVVDEHPPSGRVNAANARKLQRGFTGDNVDQHEHFVRAPITIMDAEAVEMIMNDSKRELSCGYECVTLKEDGIFEMPGHPDDGKRYDHRQTAIKYNHVAMVPRGRAGATVRLRIDSNAAVLNEIENVCYFDHKDNGKTQEPKKEIQHMTKLKLNSIEAGNFKLDSLTVEVEDSAVQHVEQLHSAVETAAIEILEQSGRADKAEGESAELKSQVEELTKKVDAAGVIAPAQIEKLAIERATMIAVAKHFKVDSTENLTNDEIKIAIVQANNPKLDVSELEPANIEGRYSMILDSAQGEIDALDSFENLALVTRKSKVKTDGDDKEELSPRDKMIQARVDAHGQTSAAAN